jgi:hypothetical protein
MAEFLRLYAVELAAAISVAVLGAVWVVFRRKFREWRELVGGWFLRRPWATALVTSLAVSFIVTVVVDVADPKARQALRWEANNAPRLDALEAALARQTLRWEIDNAPNAPFRVDCFYRAKVLTDGFGLRSGDYIYFDMVSSAELLSSPVNTKGLHGGNDGVEEKDFMAQQASKGVGWLNYDQGLRPNVTLERLCLPAG